MTYRTVYLAGALYAVLVCVLLADAVVYLRPMLEA